MRLPIFFLSFFLFFTLAFSALANEIPAPFERAKQLAMSRGIDPQTGFCSWQHRDDKEGILYVLNYIHKSFGWMRPEQVVIARWVGEEPKIVAYLVAQKKYYLFDDKSNRWGEVSKEMGEEAGFMIFRELVAKNLI